MIMITMVITVIYQEKPLTVHYGALLNFFSRGNVQNVTYYSVINPNSVRGGGPKSFIALNNITLSINSILHPVHSAAISDLIDLHHPDLFCLTETWRKQNAISAELINCTPPSYSLLSFS